jgi:hypothetical protein
LIFLHIAAPHRLAAGDLGKTTPHHTVVNMRVPLTSPCFVANTSVLSLDSRGEDGSI